MIADRGSTTLIAVGLVALALILGLGLTAVVVVVNGRAAATTAADAAALGAAPATFTPLGLGSPTEIASRLASDNGGVLVACSCRVDSSWATRSVEVEVAVEVSIPVLGIRVVRAISRAEFEPVALTGS